MLQCIMQATAKCRRKRFLLIHPVENCNNFTCLFCIPALELQPDDALVLKRRADVRGKLGNKDEAVNDYQRAIELQTMRKR